MWLLAISVCLMFGHIQEKMHLLKAKDQSIKMLLIHHCVQFLDFQCFITVI